VDPGDYDRVRDELLDRLGSFVDAKTGKTPVKEIYKREEIFKGRFADTAPDILMVPNEGYSLTHAKTALEDADWVSGDHRIEGTIVAVGPDVKPFESPPALIDMAPTLVAALGGPTDLGKRECECGSLGHCLRQRGVWRFPGLRERGQAATRRVQGGRHRHRGGEASLARLPGRDGPGHPSARDEDPVARRARRF